MLINTFVHRPVTTSMLFLGILIFALLTFSDFSIDLLPRLDIPQFYIRTTYTDASPEEVELLVTEGLEAHLSTLPNIRRITSVSREGVSVITLHFHWGTDMNIARIQTRERLDQARAFLPEQAGRPTILHVDPSTAPVMKLSLSAADAATLPVSAAFDSDQRPDRELYELREAARAILKRRLEQGRGVAQALITGGVEREIRVDVDIDKLGMLDLQLRDVATAPQRANISLPGGSIKSGHFRFALRALGEFESLEDIRNTVVDTMPGGRAILIRDIADVHDGFKDRESIARFNGRETIGILIRKEAGANTIDVSRQVHRIIEELREEYPEFHVEVVYNEAGFIGRAVAAVRQQLLWGGALAFIVLFLFLGRLREPFVIGLSIPASVMTAFLLMYIFDISINIISLGGLAVAVGMLVDNSIIVLENTNRHRSNTSDLRETAVTGAREVVLPITASTLTTIAVFLPLIFMEGLGGRLFRDQSLAITFSLLASLLVAVSLVPMLVSRSFGNNGFMDKWSNGVMDTWNNGKQHTIKNPILHYSIIPFRFLYRLIFRISEKFLPLLESRVLSHTTGLINRLRDAYERGLAWSLRHRGIVFAVLLILLGGAAMTALRMPKEFMPPIQQGHFIAEIELEPGTAIEQTSVLIAEIENSLVRLPYVISVFSGIGAADEMLITGSGSAAARHSRLAELNIRLNSPASQPAVESFIRDIASQHYGVQVSFKQPESTFETIIRPSEWDITIGVEAGTEGGFERALETAALIRQAVGDVPGLVDLQPGYELSAPEYRLVIDRQRLAAYGLTVTDLVTTITQQVRGITATEMTEFDQKIPVLVHTSLYKPGSIDELLRTHLHFTDRASSPTLPVREFVSFYQTVGFSEVYRERQNRMLQFHGSVRGRPLERVIDDISERVSSLSAEDVRIHIGGVQDDIGDMLEQIRWILLISLLLIYMILASQYESVLVPLVIMGAVPMALIGAIFLLALTGTSINLVAMIGMIVLTGIAANDAIVKVDFILRMRRKGMNRDAAIMEAGLLRFRPIIMTTATLVFGLLPMALFGGAGSQLQYPLAVAVLGGIISSTALTLFVMPVMYSFVDFLIKFNHRDTEG
jgi:hydrophobic/amphiphilic exporter-1 (mainly G- bacteria), HAE1 family